jgi:hypothetical protein
MVTTAILRVPNLYAYISYISNDIVPRNGARNEGSVKTLQYNFTVTVKHVHCASASAIKMSNDKMYKLWNDL